MQNFLPIVSVICPTTHDRKDFNDRIYQLFMKQDYVSKHIMFDYGEGAIGTKRNRLCDQAPGDILLMMDSDDIYAPDWISRSVKELMESEADITGLSKLNFTNLEDDFATWQYTYANNSSPWLAGATMCFWKNFWKNNPFPDRQQGEDAFLLWDAKVPAIVHVHNYIEGFLATIHEGNTCKRLLHNVAYQRLSEEEEQVIKDRWRGLVAGTIAPI